MSTSPAPPFRPLVPTLDVLSYPVTTTPSLPSRPSLETLNDLRDLPTDSPVPKYDSSTGVPYSPHRSRGKFPVLTLRLRRPSTVSTTPTLVGQTRERHTIREVQPLDPFPWTRPGTPSVCQARETLELPVTPSYTLIVMSDP